MRWKVVGIYLEIKGKQRYWKAPVVLRHFQKIFEIMVNKNFFTPTYSALWEGYPLEGIGTLIESGFPLNSINTSKIRRYDRNGEQPRLHIRSIEITGYFHLFFDDELLKVPGRMMLCGDIISKDMPDIYIDTFTYFEKDFPDFFKESNRNYRQNQTKMFDVLAIFMEAIKDNRKDVNLIIGDTFESVDLLHQAVYFDFPSMHEFYKKFLRYVSLLKQKRNSLEWINRLDYKKINDLYNRIVYLKESFLPDTMDTINIMLRGKDKPLTDYLINRMNQMVEVSAGSVIIKDPDFSGQNMQKALTELLVDFSEIVKDVFDPKKTIQEQFAEAYKEKLKNYDFNI